jgi:hypothetical protein
MVGRVEALSVVAGLKMHLTGSPEAESVCGAGSIASRALEDNAVGRRWWLLGVDPVGVECGRDRYESGKENGGSHDTQSRSGYVTSLISRAGNGEVEMQNFFTRPELRV